MYYTTHARCSPWGGGVLGGQLLDVNAFAPYFLDMVGYILFGPDKFLSTHPRLNTSFIDQTMPHLVPRQ